MAVAALGILATAAAVGIGTLVLLPDSKDGGPPPQAAERFSGADLKDRVASLLSARTSAAESPEVGLTSGEPTKGPYNMPKAENVPIIPECVSRGIARDEEPLVAEDGTYQGTQAWLVVLPHASSPNRVSAYVVDASCEKQDQSTAKGAVLLETSYPRN